jgi:diguanylate cyclase (GGDEF)-like protein
VRGDPHPPSAREPRLNRGREYALGAVAAVLLLLALATGGARSPVTLLLISALILLLRAATRPLVLLAPAACALAFLTASTLGSGIDLHAVIAAVAVLASTLAGVTWRREAKFAAARLTHLDDILAQTERTANAGARAAADELADLARALAAVAASLGASLATVWAIDARAGLARPRAASAPRPLAPVRLSGDPLGWAWEQGMRLRLEPSPRWAEPGTLVVAERLRRTGDAGDLVSFVFEASQPLPSDEAFDQAAIYLRGITALHEARALAAAGERRVAALLNGLRGIPGALELAPLARELCNTAMSVTEASGALVGIWDGQRGEVLAVCGADGGPHAGDSFELPASELALAIRADTILIRDAQRWTLGRTCVAHAEERWVARPRALAALPLQGAGGAIGVLAVWSSRARSLDPAALELLHLMSPYAALHLEHAHAFGRLRETAERDPLTHLRNRRAFDEILAGEVIRYERYGRPLALMVVDIDHFKSINDSFGHEAGDEVLRRIARLLAARVRDADTAARMGGEEFVVLLPETSLTAAAEVAERMRAAVSELQIEWRNSPVPVHVSIGVSAAPERVGHPHQLINSADSALYRAKASGRDRVVVA